MTVVAIALTGSLLSAMGCQKTLFTGDEERTQFDRHDAARGQLASPTRMDAYGELKPNLRGRLLITE